MTRLQQTYHELSLNVIAIRDNIEANVNLYPDYLGWADLGSPIFEEPDILFMGINPGPGRFIQWNWSNWDNKKHRLAGSSKKVLPQDFPHLWRSHLQWLVPDNARKNGEWWDTSKGKKNFYPYYMCELLVKIFRHEFPSVMRKELTDVFERRVMDANLFPMSTHDMRRLHTLIREYDKANGSDIRATCHRHVLDLVKTVHPHCIVFLGSTVYKELSTDLRRTGIPLYCINRGAGWHGKKNIMRMANEIYELIHNRQSFTNG